MLGAGALHLFSLEKRWLQVDVIAACQHQQGGHREDDLHSDGGEMRDTGPKSEHERFNWLSGRTFSPRGQSDVGAGYSDNLCSLSPGKFSRLN